MNIGAECRSNEMVITILCVSLKGSATSLKKIGAVLAALGRPDTSVTEVAGKN